MSEKKKILIIEDDPDQIFIYKMELENNGFEVVSKETEVDALEYAKTSLPDLILIDMLIGNSDGLSILKKLKKDPKTKNIKAVMFTNYKKEGLTEECLKEGALDYLLKTDYIPSELSKKVKSWL